MPRNTASYSYFIIQVAGRKWRYKTELKGEAARRLPPDKFLEELKSILPFVERCIARAEAENIAPPANTEAVK